MGVLINPVSEAQMTTMVRAALIPTQVLRPTQDRPMRTFRHKDLHHVMACSRQQLILAINAQENGRLRAGLWGIHDARLAQALLHNGTPISFAEEAVDELMCVTHPLDDDLPGDVELLLNACDVVTAPIRMIDVILRRLNHPIVATYLRGVRYCRRLSIDSAVVGTLAVN